MSPRTRIAVSACERSRIPKATSLRRAARTPSLIPTKAAPSARYARVHAAYVAWSQGRRPRIAMKASSHASTATPARIAALERFIGWPPGFGPAGRLPCRRDATATGSQQVRESDLVELAVVPEPRDEDEGDQEQERRADQERPDAGVHPLTRSPARPRTDRSRRGGCGRRCPGSRSASSRTGSGAGTRSR